MRGIICLTVRRLSVQSAEMMTPRVALRILGLSSSVREQELSASAVDWGKLLKKAYIAKTLSCHPDLFPHDATATERFKELSEAFRVALEFSSTAADGMSSATGSAATPSWRAFATMQEHLDEYVATRRRVYGAAASSAASNLGDVAAVCRAETIAGRRQRTLVEELPTLLCGRECQLFEVFCFHPSRCVDALTPLVLRFSKELPRIVSRVIKRRDTMVRYSANAEWSSYGIGSGDAARQKKIEEMLMKPLVLLGALILAESRDTAAAHHLGGLTEGAIADGAAAGPVVAFGRPNVRSGSDVFCAPELRCVVTTEDSLDDIVRKVGVWEANSFDRLRLELGMASALSVMSQMLLQTPDAAEHGTCCAFSIAHDLSLSLSSVEPVALTVQRLLSLLCAAQRTQDADLASGKPVDAIAILRAAEGATEHIKGGIQLVLPPKQRLTTDLIQTREELLCGPLGAAPPPEFSGDGFHVGRHPAEFDATSVAFAVSVTLHKDLDVFLERLRAALLKVQDCAVSAAELLPDLLRVRDGVTSSEYLNVDGSAVNIQIADVLDSPAESIQGTSPFSVSTDDAPGDAIKSTAVQEDVVEALTSQPPLWAQRLSTSMDEPDFTALLSSAPSSDQSTASRVVGSSASAPRLVHRDAVHCVHRVYNMMTGDELQLWRMLSKHTQYLAVRQRLFAPLHIFFECAPHTHGQLRRAEMKWDGKMKGGWCSDGEDGDAVVLTRAELEDEGQFQSWLEDVVEQSSLAKESRTLLLAEGICYVEREPSLPLSCFLSFLKLFTSPRGVAARQLVERRPLAAGGAHAPRRLVTVSDSGFVIVVSNNSFDVREGGRLYLPWSLDPSQLVAVLTERETAELLVE